MIPISKVTELMPEYKSKFIFRLNLVKQPLRDDDKSARQCHCVGRARVVNLDAKVIRHIGPVARQLIDEGLCALPLFTRRIDRHHVLGHPVAKEPCLTLGRHEVKNDLDQENEQQRNANKDSG